MINNKTYQDMLNYVSSNFEQLQNEVNLFFYKLSLVSKLAYNNVKLEAYERCAQQADKLSCLKDTQENLQKMDNFLDKANEALEQTNKMLEPAVPYIIAGLGMYAAYKVVSTVASYCTGNQQDAEEQQAVITAPEEAQRNVQQHEVNIPQADEVGIPQAVVVDDRTLVGNVSQQQTDSPIARRHSI